jgi:hypothetical protein
MTTLLLSTFVLGGLHTLMWLPKALEMRRELRAEEAREKAEAPGSAHRKTDSAGEDGNHVL